MVLVVRYLTQTTTGIAPMQGPHDQARIHRLTLIAFDLYRQPLRRALMQVLPQPQPPPQTTPLRTRMQILAVHPVPTLERRKLSDLG